VGIVRTAAVWHSALEDRQVAARQVARTIAFGSMVLVAGLTLGAAVVDPRLRPLLAAFLTAGALAFVFRFPFASTCVFLLLTDSIFHETFLNVELGALGLRPHHMLLVALILVAVVHPRRRTWGGTAGASLGGFLAFVSLSAALGVAAGRMDLQAAFNWARPFALLAFFYVVVRLFPDTRQARSLLAVGAVLGGLTGLVAVLAAFGSGLDSVADGFVTDQQGLGGLERVRLPGLALAYTLFWFAAAKTIETRGRHRLSWAAVLIGMAANIAVSFNRNMWLGLMLGLALALLFSGAPTRHRLFTGITVAATAVTLLMVTGPDPGRRPELAPLIERGSTLLAPASLAEEQSLRDRQIETDHAWSAAREHIFTGIGAGAPWGSYFDMGSSTTGFTRTPQLFLHNQYLYLVLVAGLPGLICFLLFLGSVLRAAWTRRSRGDSTLWAPGVGLAMAMLSALAMISFSVDNWTAVIGLLAGAIVAIADSGESRPRFSPNAAPEHIQAQASENPDGDSRIGLWGRGIAAREPSLEPLRSGKPDDGRPHSRRVEGV
jgi:O-antigen ligase